MRTSIILFLLIIFSILCAHTQAQRIRSYTYDEKSIIKDSLGNIVPFEKWNLLLSSTHYVIKIVRDKNGDSSYVLSYLTSEQQLMVSKRNPPRICPFFQLGQHINVDVQDINGESFNEKKMLGKIVVINFWTITEFYENMITSLNSIIDSFSNNGNVVFLAICIDDKEKVNKYLSTHSFKFKIVPDGKKAADDLGVNLFPAFVILDITGKIVFHSCGAGTTTTYWVNKKINELIK